MGTDRQQGNQPVKCAGQYLPLMISNRYTIIECRESPARTSPSTRWQIRVSAGQIGPYLPAEKRRFPAHCTTLRNIVADQASFKQTDKRANETGQDMTSVCQR